MALSTSSSSSSSFSNSQYTSKNVNLKQYSNGFRVIYQHVENPQPVSYIYLYVECGSVNEQDGGIRGASHFVEHMLFEGTKTPKFKRGPQISAVFDGIGASVDAYTERDHTCYMIQCDARHTKKSILILSDMIFNSTFDRDEMKREEKIVIEEVKKDRDYPNVLAETIAYNLLYRQTPLEFNVDDSKFHEPGVGLNHDLVLEFYALHYRPQNMVLSICSTDFHDDFDKTIHRYIKQSYFAKTSPQIKTSVHQLMKTLSVVAPKEKQRKNRIFGDIPPPQSTIQLEVIKKPDLDKVSFTIGFRTCSMYNTDVFALEVLSVLLNGPMSSRFYVVLREKYGINYHTSVTTSYFKTIGDLCISSDVETSRLISSHKTGPGVIRIIMKILSDLSTGRKPITDEELEKIRGYISGSDKINNTYIEDNVEYNGTRVLFQFPTFVSFQERLEKFFLHVTKEQLTDVAKKYFRKNLMSACFVGSPQISRKKILKELDHLKEIKNIYSINKTSKNREREREQQYPDTRRNRRLPEPTSSSSYSSF